MEQGAGDVWTWTAIDADTKLIISYMLGDRGAGTATAFMQDAAARIANRVQLTTDGHHVYVDAVEDAFGAKNVFTLRPIATSITHTCAIAETSDRRWPLQRIPLS